MPSLDENKWKSLVNRIRQGLCTPFLGAGVHDTRTLPLGKTIALKWAEERRYPLKDTEDLTRVSQYLAITDLDPMECKDELCRRWFTDVPLPDFNDPKSALGLLSELPLPLYITTNYDSLLYKALRSRNKNPSREFCRWNDHPQMRSHGSVWTDNEGYRPTSGSVAYQCRSAFARESVDCILFSRDSGFGRTNSESSAAGNSMSTLDVGNQ